LSGLLALFDLDGTLFLTHDPLSGAALRATLEEVYGIEVAEDAPDNVEHRGLTAERIARNVLRAAGLTDDEIDDRLPSWCSRYAERYLELLAASDTRDWKARPGAAGGLARLEAAGVWIALVTGNPEPVARARLERLGLVAFFPPGQGAFGCEAEERTILLELARHRAQDWPAERTAEVGDTREDVTTAKAVGIHSIAVASERSDLAELAGADALVGDMDGIVQALLALGTKRAARSSGQASARGRPGLGRGRAR
jgi:phosphoglycolate phosphatase-like HAD superfamily hydrolase